MVDLVAAAQRMGLSMEDIEALRRTPGATMMDLGLPGFSQRPGSTADFSSLTPLPMQMPQAASYRANPANYKADPRGNFVGDAMIDAAAMYGDLSGQLKSGLDRPLRQAKVGAGKLIGRGGRRMAGNALGALKGVPGIAKAGAILGAAAPALGAAGGALAVGDLVLGEESLANKAMDATAMTIGGTLGAVGGPLGIAAGAGIGKALSDGTQWLFGDKKTPEQRKMELALQQLQGGGMY